jgi:hypothetical protein
VIREFSTLPLRKNRHLKIDAHSLSLKATVLDALNKLFLQLCGNMEHQQVSIATLPDVNLNLFFHFPASSTSFFKKGGWPTFCWFLSKPTTN